MQSIYVYLNDADLDGVLEALQVQGCFGVHSISQSLEAYEIVRDGDAVLTFFPCAFHGKLLQPGAFKVDKSGPLFAALKKYIKATFTLSKDRSYYIGPGMYQQWLRGGPALPVLFDYEKVTVPRESVSAILTMALHDGFKMQMNRARLRDLRAFEFPCDSFVIFRDERKLLHTALSKNRFCYLYGSECIFAYRNEKASGYDFELDSRIGDPELPGFFQKIKMKASEARGSY